MNKKDESFKDFVFDQLRELDGVEARRMFGGFGLYQDQTFSALCTKGAFTSKSTSLPLAPRQGCRHADARQREKNSGEDLRWTSRSTYSAV